MLTPPYHFSIVSAPPPPTPPTTALDPYSQDGAAAAAAAAFGPDQAPGSSSSSSWTWAAREVLYRGAIPTERSLRFIAGKKLKTVIYLRGEELGQDDLFVKWAEGKRVGLRWIKAQEMTEEKLGISKQEVGEVLKAILDRSLYPLYIADLDGISHTTLIIACLRKLQGWHMDSILDEICRFEPDHEDFSLVPFITSYLSAADSSLILPPPPYPSWLWPVTPSSSSSSVPLGGSGSALTTGSAASGSGMAINSNQNQRTREPISGEDGTSLFGAGSSGTISGRPGTAPVQGPNGVMSPPPGPTVVTQSGQRSRIDRDRERESQRERTKTIESSTSASGRTHSLLPFPNPLQARKHPTMRGLSFPTPPPAPAPTQQPQPQTTTTTTAAGSSTSGSPSFPPTGTSYTHGANLSRVSTRMEGYPPPGVGGPSTSGYSREGQALSRVSTRADTGSEPRTNLSRVSTRLERVGTEDSRTSPVLIGGIPSVPISHQVNLPLVSASAPPTADGGLGPIPGDLRDAMTGGGGSAGPASIRSPQPVVAVSAGTASGIDAALSGSGSVTADVDTPTQQKDTGFSRHATFSSHYTSSTDASHSGVNDGEGDIDVSMTPEDMGSEEGQYESGDEDGRVDYENYDDDEEDEEESEEDEEDEDEDEDGPTSQYISALDLAGFT